MNEANSIKNWKEDERPREKLLYKGPASLTDAELLAILINSGTKTASALELARQMLRLTNDNLVELGRLGIVEMCTIKGIGEARAITVAAALELGRRRRTSEARMREIINKSFDAAEVLQPLMQDEMVEVFYVLYLSQSNRLIKTEKLSSGGISATVVDIRVLLRNCLTLNSTRIMIGHNHPGGSLTPSATDVALTRQVAAAASVMDIKLVDHLIFADNKYLSMADQGYM